MKKSDAGWRSERVKLKARQFHAPGSLDAKEIPGVNGQYNKTTRKLGPIWRGVASQGLTPGSHDRSIYVTIYMLDMIADCALMVIAPPLCALAMRG